MWKNRTEDEIVRFRAPEHPGTQDFAVLGVDSRPRYAGSDLDMLVYLPRKYFLRFPSVCAATHQAWGD